MPPFIKFLSTKTKSAKPRSKSKSKSISFSPATKSKIAIFTKKRNMRHLFKRINEIQETKKKIDSFTRKRKNKISQRVFRRIKSGDSIKIDQISAFVTSLGPSSNFLEDIQRFLD